MVANAARLCEANFGALNLFESDAFRIVAMHNVPDAFAEFRRNPIVPFDQVGPDHPLARQIVTKQVLHIADVRVEPAYLEGDRSFVRFVDLAGPRTLLYVPMLKENDLIGAYRYLPPRGSPFHRQADRVSQELRCPSGHRH